MGDEMTDTKFVDILVGVTAFMDDQGRISPQQLVLRGQSVSIVSVGRQWQSESGRHVLVEAGDGARYELLLSQAELVWRIKRMWPLELAA
ncbi:MAG: hypothetical protein Kow0031_22430 [Anaerolineae bacterium]